MRLSREFVLPLHIVYGFARHKSAQNLNHIYIED